MQEKRPRWTTMSSTKLRPHGEQLHATWSTWSAASAATGRVLGCWQLQDAPDYHLSRARGQGRLRRCEGVLWTFKHRKISKSRKRALLGHLARSGPRRAHRLASTLPAVARATVVCFLRCECLRGRDVGRPRDPSRRWGARCSSGRVNLENGASVRAPLRPLLVTPKNRRAVVRRAHLAPQRKIIHCQRNRVAFYKVVVVRISLH